MFPKLLTDDSQLKLPMHTLQMKVSIFERCEISIALEVVKHLETSPQAS